jgi:predicted Abi (CAAX) family protease
MSGVSKEQIARAKEVGIEDYILSHEPNNIKKIGNALYLRDHDSLEISNNLWNWHSQGIGGKNVIDYLIKVRGYDFVRCGTWRATITAWRNHAPRLNRNRLEATFARLNVNRLSCRRATVITSALSRTCSHA